MFGINQTQKIFICGKPCDMRKGFNGLFGLEQNETWSGLFGQVISCKYI